MHCLRRGLTLIELIVAMSILVLLITLTGLVFAQVGLSTEQVGSVLRANGCVQTLERRLRADLSGATADGVLIIANEGVDPSVSPPLVRPPLLLMTTTGRYVSQTDWTLAGGPLTANAAIIVYTLGSSTTPSARGQILCRYVFLLTGSGSPPLTLADLPALAADRNPLDNSDVLGESLAGVCRREYALASGHDAFILPLLPPRTVNLLPADADDPVAGGVRQLWPFMIDGVQSIEWAWCDGLEPDGVTPSPGAARWFVPGTPEAKTAGMNRKGNHGQPLVTNFHQVIWDRHTNARRPRALRATVRLVGATPDSPVQPYEIVISLRR